MKISIGFSGDIAFSEYTKEIYKDKNVLDKKIYSFLNKNDYNVLNFESPVTQSNITKKAALAHKSSYDSLLFVKKNFKNIILSLANNHMMDFGPKGLLDTINTLEKEKITYIGAGKNQDEATKYVIVGDEVKVGIISCQYKKYMIATEEDPGTAQDYHFDIIKRKIKELKQKVDWVVMVYHGGEEFLNVPMPYTRKMYKQMLGWGADIVVAHHPHTVQGYEKIGKKMIFYSLGNFIFDTDFQRAQDGTDEGVLLSISFDKNDFSFDKLFLKRNRDKNTLEVVNENTHFNNILVKYSRNWRSEARRLDDIKARKKELRRYRNRYVVSNLFIEKIDIKSLVSFDYLIKKNSFEGIDEPVVFSRSFILVRKFRKLRKKLRRANYKKHFYRKFAKIFRW